MNVNDNLVNEIATFVAGALQGTTLGSKFVDITKIKSILSPIITRTIERLDKTDEVKILAFIKNKALLQQCVVPNVEQILADGKIALDDIPAFLNLIIGVYGGINEFVQSNKTIVISSNDIVELVGLLVKVIVCVLVTDSSQITLVNTLVESAISMINLTVKAKSFSLKCCCCCGSN